MADFKRLGVLGDWDHPYKTMDFANEAGEIRAFKRVIERGFVYRGLKPVYWCFDCGSSLAEFEIEYADKKSQTLDVGFLAPSRRSSPPPSACRRWPRTPSPSSGPPPPGPSRPTRRSTSTPSSTTRWSTPSAACWCWPRRWSRSAWTRYELDGKVLATVKGEKLGGLELPASAVRRRRRLPPPVAGVPGRLRHRRRRHRHRPLLAGLRPGRLQLLRRARPGATTTS